MILDDRPGELARLGEVIGDAGVNIRGLAAFTGEGKGVIHLQTKTGKGTTFTIYLPAHDLPPA